MLAVTESRHYELVPSVILFNSMFNEPTNAGIYFLLNHFLISNDAGQARNWRWLFSFLSSFVTAMIESGCCTETQDFMLKSNVGNKVTARKLRL